MASSVIKGDKYRSFIYGDDEKDTVWRYGTPPNYDVVNKLFEEGRTQVMILFLSMSIKKKKQVLY